MRIAPGRDGVSIWSPELFSAGRPDLIREFLTRSFSVPDVTSVELRRAKGYGRVRFARTGRAAEIWRHLGEVLRKGVPILPGRRASRTALAGRDAGQLSAGVYLDWPDASSLTISRIGGALTSWRLRKLQADGQDAQAGYVRLFHPALRGRRDVAFRLEERLSTVVGVDKVSANAVTAQLVVHFRPEVLRIAFLVRELERAWDYVLHGADAPLPRGRLVAGAGVLGLAYAGQVAVPALLPVALAGYALYGLPSVIATLRDLRQRRVGVAALATTRLAFSLLRGALLHSSAIALLVQLWPRLAFRAFNGNQRRLFAGVRRRALSARLVTGEDGIVSFDVDALVPGDVVLVRAGDIIPVDGVVVKGVGEADEAALTGQRGPVDKLPGDRVYSASVLTAGEIRVRVEGVGEATAAGTIAASLPHTRFRNLELDREARRIADRNARPALAVALASLAFSGQLRSAQAILRPDYITEPRLGAQLGTLNGLAAALGHGIHVRVPAALDRIAHVDTLVFDDSAGIAELFTDVDAQPVLAALLARRPRLRFIYLSAQPHAEAAAIAAKAGIALVHAGLDGQAKVDLLRAYGPNAAVVGGGEGREPAGLGISASVSISVAGLAGVAGATADVVLTRGSLKQLVALWDVASRYRSRIARDYRTVYASNLTALGVALAAGFGSFEVALASNAATSALMARHWWGLKALPAPGAETGEGGAAHEAFPAPESEVLPVFGLPRHNVPDAEEAEIEPLHLDSTGE